MTTLTPDAANRVVELIGEIAEIRAEIILCIDAAHAGIILKHRENELRYILRGGDPPFDHRDEYGNRMIAGET